MPKCSVHISYLTLTAYFKLITSLPAMASIIPFPGDGTLPFHASFTVLPASVHRRRLRKPLPPGWKAGWSWGNQLQALVRQQANILSGAARGTPYNLRAGAAHRQGGGTAVALKSIACSSALPSQHSVVVPSSKPKNVELSVTKCHAQRFFMRGVPSILGLVARGGYG